MLVQVLVILLLLGRVLLMGHRKNGSSPKNWESSSMNHLQSTSLTN